MDKDRAIAYIQKVMRQYEGGKITKSQLEASLFLIAYWIFTEQPDDEPSL